MIPLKIGQFRNPAAIFPGYFLNGLSCRGKGSSLPGFPEFFSGILLKFLEDKIL